MIDNLLEKLAHRDDDTRLASWKEVSRQLNDLRACRKLLEHRTFLVHTASSESNAVIRETAKMTLISLSLEGAQQSLTSLQSDAHSTPGSQPAPPIDQGPDPAVKKDIPLIRWLWQPFRQKSVIFHTASSDHQQRDVEAIFSLGQFFSKANFPHIHMVRLPFQGTDWRKKITRPRLKAACFLGRLGLYGEDVAHHLEKRNARFQFLSHDRPAPDQSNSLADEYHCIREVLDSGETDLHYTEENGNTRTDVGIVQRYCCRIGNQPFVLIHCAGASALGTLAAIRWVTEDLQNHIQVDDERAIPTPPGIGERSELEALIRVTAENEPNRWKTTCISLERLYVDDFCWNSNESTWEEQTPSLITLVREHDEEIADILLDGRPLRMQKNSDSRNLLIHICLQKYDESPQVAEIDLDALLQTFNHGKDVATVVDRRKIIKQLDTLRNRHLRRGLRVGSNPRLFPRVEIEDKNKVLLNPRHT